MPDVTINDLAGPVWTHDLSVSDEGSVFLLTPHSLVGREWCQNHLPADATRFGSAYVVEPRYVEDIVLGAITDSLIVEIID